MGITKTKMILVTGANGVIGRHLVLRIERSGVAVRRFDVSNSAVEDIRDPTALEVALDGVEGVVHLAAVSRVVRAQEQPMLAWAVNVEALDRLLGLCLASGRRPWFLFVSSREVYGNASAIPVTEDAEPNPVNVYARSKHRGEELVERAARRGLRASICRLSNVYGCPLDHGDRVVMAFANAAVTGGVMRVEGRSNVFDFTYIHDVVDGLWSAMEVMMARERLPPIHLASGSGTSLWDLANLAAANALKNVRIEEAPRRDFDVTRFVGDPTRARQLLGWEAKTPLSTGMPQVIRALSRPSATGTGNTVQTPRHHD